MGKLKSTESMVNRNLQLPRSIWDALDRDAARCGRSAVKQLWALLTAYYNLGDIELSRQSLDDMRLASIPLAQSPATKNPDNPDIPTGIASPLTFPTKRGGRK